MNTSPSNQVVRASELSGFASVRHGFFTRNERDDQIRGEANCAFRTPEEAAAVTATRARYLATVGGTALVTVSQKHTPDVVVVDAPWPRERNPVADALVTKCPGVALGILTADCAPILLADAEAGVIGAAHAGWRGAFDGVIQNTVDAMTANGAKAERIVAVVGPCIDVASYEVGPEFEERFVTRNPVFAGYFTHDTPRPHFNLPAFVQSRLKAAGVNAAHILGRDTCTEEDMFFSFRRATLRGEADYGRQMSVIALQGKTA
jgi:YfiH family protein